MARLGGITTGTVTRGLAAMQAALAETVAPMLSLTIAGTAYDVAGTAVRRQRFREGGGEIQTWELDVLVPVADLAASVVVDTAVANHPVKEVLLVHAGIRYRLRTVNQDATGTLWHLHATEEYERR